MSGNASASGRVPVRGGSHLRRGPSVRRASARVSLARVGAVVVLFAVSLGLAQLIGPTAFAVGSVEVEGAVISDRAALAAALLEGAPQNVFRYDTDAAAARLGRFPAVRHASVRAVLPGRVVATIEERTAVLRWVVDGAAFLVDADGLLFASLLADGATTSADVVPSVEDQRGASAGLAVGSRVGAVDVRVARELGALTPAMIGSTAASLVLAVDDDHGFSLSGSGWSAVFGLYGEVTRSPDLVPLQAQCLASLLADRGEAAVGHVVLSPEGQLCGTYGAP